MAKDKLNPQLAAELARLAAMPDSAIDMTDPEAPETDFSAGVRGRFYRPVKQQLTLRLDADLVDWFRRHPGEGRGYQSHMNAALRLYVQQHEKGPA